MVRRLFIVLAIAAVAAAAPARAWCEASCLAPVATQTSHCPSHGSTSDTTAIAASSLEDCPVLESARPTVPARLDVQAVAIGAHLPAPRAALRSAPAPVTAHRARTVFERRTPLRI